MLRVATDRSCWPRDLPLTPLLQPLFGERDARAGVASWDGRFDEYASRAQGLFDLVPVAEADVVVLPGDWYWVRGTSWRSRPDRDLVVGVRPLYERALAAGRPVVAFFSGDRSCDHFPLQHVHVFREGGFRTRNGPLDHALPAFVEDVVASHGDGRFAERPWRPVPTVGFCGLARSKPRWRRAAGLVAYRLAVAARERRIDPSPYLGEVLRAAALEVLEQSPEVTTNFVLRDEKVFFRDAGTGDLDGVRRAYMDNLRDSDYVLCVRGSGNYSYRLYEAMCMGRVPVVVDTDLALPCGDVIDWSELTVWVEQGSLRSLAESVAAFHARLGRGGFSALQRRLRQVWLDT
ncbi:MAG: exostosin domain-containing protein, partial [Ilumatobacteraceae bacterium]